MSDDYRDKIQEIRARRGKTQSYTPQGPAPGTPGGKSAYELTPGVGSNRVAPSLGINIAQQAPTAAEILGPDFKSPWLKDRVTLSLEGQISMMELRGNTRVNPGLYHQDSCSRGSHGYLRSSRAAGNISSLLSLPIKRIQAQSQKKPTGEENSVGFLFDSRHCLGRS